MPLKLMYITNSPDVAVIAQRYGVDRIWIDLETLGKEERQKNMNTVKSNHSIADIKMIRPLLSSSELLVRINPWNDNSKNEVDQVVEAGADIIMLPMWKSTTDVKKFVEAVNQRAKVVLLLETREAAECLDEVLLIKGIDEIHIGLNDLHLSYGLNFMFELLSDGTVEVLCKKIQEVGIPYGFGGIARIGEGMLPAEKIVLEHYRLGSTRAILSRSFCNTDEIVNISDVEAVFEANMRTLREFESAIDVDDRLMLIENKDEVKKCVESIVLNKRG